MINFKTRINGGNPKILGKHRDRQVLTEEDIIAIRKKFKIIPKELNDKRGFKKNDF